MMPPLVEYEAAEVYYREHGLEEKVADIIRKKGW